MEGRIRGGWGMVITSGERGKKLSGVLLDYNLSNHLLVRMVP